MLRKSLLTVVTSAALLTVVGCANRPDYETYAYAEKGDYDSALASAQEAQGSGIDGWVFGTGASECRDYGAVITVLVAQGDFQGARQACANYDQQCAVLPDSRLCFYYALDELQAADSDPELAESMRNYAQESLHFRWLTIRDDYENRPLKRPIY